MGTKVTVVEFGPEVDSIMALYVDGKCFTYGDYYHDKIRDFIRGWVHCWANGDRKAAEQVEYIAVPVNECLDVLEDGSPIPNVWPDGHYSAHAKPSKPFQL